MSAVPVPEPVDVTVPGGIVAFTPRGEAALHELATVLVARCSTTPRASPRSSTR